VRFFRQADSPGKSRLAAAVVAAVAVAAFAEDQLQGPVGVVGADVTSIVLRLDDGRQVKLLPDGRYGYRLVAFVLPERSGVVTATAYLSNGQYATAIPSDDNGLLFISSWLWHGAHGP
jgi:hypothetical protein